MPEGAAWLERLPAVVEELAHRWSLDLGSPFPAHISLVLPVARHGEPAVLKVNIPEPESECEADALACWDGDGAARLLERADDLRALLIEKLVPGHELWRVEDEDRANRIAAGVLRQLRKNPPADHPFRLLETEACRWAEEIPRDWQLLGRPFDRRLLDTALAAVRELAPTQPELVVCHQDFHGGNVLSDGVGWRAIDPKPLVGEPAFDAASLLRDRGWRLEEPGAAHRLRRRLDLLSAELDLDRERLRGWAIVHALAWGLSSDKLEDGMVECAPARYGSLT